ncbi:MAG TPA: hypothetical protein VIM05_06170 [Gaiellaceae bacterium]
MSMTMPFSPRVRMFLVVIVLACAAVGAGLIVLGRRQSASDASPGKPILPAAPLKRPAAARPAVKTPGVKTPGLKTPAARARLRASKAAIANQLPAAIRQALAANQVVVVALFDPNAKIDDTAMREAEAGAQMTGTTFVSVDVTQDAIESLNTRYGVIQDPAVLVLKPPGDLVVRIDGFADRDTVAQAAANAAS